MNTPALEFVVLTVAGWLGRRQAAMIDYLVAEARVLREQLGDRRLRLTDAQRRRLAVRGKAIGRKALGEIASIVTPDTIALASRARGEEVRRQQPSRAGAATDGGGHRRADSSHGRRESAMGLHADPGCPE